MSPDVAQCEQDRGDARAGVSVVQLQWDAYDTHVAALKARSAWQTARINAEPVATRTELGLELSHDYLAFKKMTPPMPVPNVVQLVPADHDGRKPYWGE